MKNFISSIFALFFIFAVISCGGKSDKETEDVSVTDTEELIEDKLDKMVDELEEAAENIDAELDELENEVDSLLND